MKDTELATEARGIKEERELVVRLGRVRRCDGNRIDDMTDETHELIMNPMFGNGSAIGKLTIENHNDSTIPASPMVISQLRLLFS